MADLIIPNANLNLVVLYVWLKRDEGLENTCELPIIAWKISETDFPVPVCVGCEPDKDEARGYMVFDRVAQIGYPSGAAVHGREVCVAELHCDIAHRQRNAVKRGAHK